MKRSPILQIPLQDAVRLWFHCQGMDTPRGSQSLTRETFVKLIERVGALQLDSVNVIERAHYLTLWSRFGTYDRNELDTWIYQDRLAYEYWGHEASVLPMSHLPLSRRRMRDFPPESWLNSAWWPRHETSPASKRRVLKQLQKKGSLESAAFTQSAPKHAQDSEKLIFQTAKEDKRSLEILWHAGKTAISGRRHFRRIYDLAERVYPETDVASKAAYEDSWLFAGLKGQGIASEQHMINYFTAPKLKGPERKQVIERNLKKKKIIEVGIQGRSEQYYMMPEHQALLGKLNAPTGTTLVCPFDSLLWQRSRAEEWLDFRYRIEIYVPQKKREFGYYVLPILHNGRLVGRLDPKLHRKNGTLEIKALYLEEGFERSNQFNRELRETLHDLSKFLGATDLNLPTGWSGLS